MIKINFEYENDVIYYCNFIIETSKKTIKTKNTFLKIREKEKIKYLLDLYCIKNKKFKIDIFLIKELSKTSIK